MSNEHGHPQLSASHVASETIMAKKKQTEFGIAMRNFTKYPEMPSAQGLD